MKPILFNTEMVRAILDGSKTQTRRILKPQPPEWIGKLYGPEMYTPAIEDKDGYIVPGDDIYGVYDNSGDYGTKCPYKPGDILWVRETWLKADDGIYYKADIKVLSESEDMRKAYGYKWNPSIHMPKGAARIFLRVTGVRVERLGDITIQDMIQEGVKVDDITTAQGIIEYRVINRFEELWNSTIKKKDLYMYGFDASPWVCAIEFERVEGLNGG
jgi:hypothetical protein